MTVDFRPLTASDLPAIEGSKPTDLYLILSEDRPAGLIQTSACPIIRSTASSSPGDDNRPHTLLRLDR